MLKLKWSKYMKQRDLEAIHTIIEHAKLVFEQTENISEDDFVENTTLFHSVLWSITVIGESANRLDPHTIDELPGESLKNAIAARHRIVHGYDSIDSHLVFLMATIHIPKLYVEFKHME